MTDREQAWPALRLDEWADTKDTLQLWTQVIGKVRMARTPLVNHWWNVTLHVTATGLTTSLVPDGHGGAFQIDLDLVVAPGRHHDDRRTYPPGRAGASVGGRLPPRADGPPR